MENEIKTETDYWLTKNYLDTTINSVPHLIWYKNKVGAHLKVNESFCQTVNKTGNNFKWVDKIKYCAIILSI